MTKFLDKSFSSRPATEAYRSHWEETFGKKRVGATPLEEVKAQRRTKDEAKKQEAPTEYVEAPIDGDSVP